MADVNLLRVYEIDFDRPPQVAVAPETIRSLIEQFGTSKLIPVEPRERTALYRADPINIVRIMFELRARELYPEIEVITEPWALNLFRQRVHNTWLIQNCADVAPAAKSRAGQRGGVGPSTPPRSRAIRGGSHVAPRSRHPLANGSPKQPTKCPRSPHRRLGD